MDSILQTIKQQLGLAIDYNAFDEEIIIHINSALSFLTQIGIGPTAGYSITGPFETWTAFMGDDSRKEMAKTYIYLKVRNLFDPPANSYVMTAFENQIKEIEWRMLVVSESTTTDDDTDDDDADEST